MERTLSVSRLFKVCSGVSDALAFAFCILLCFIAWDILPDCALRLDGKAWPHSQTARLLCYIADIPCSICCPSGTEINPETHHVASSRCACSPANGITHIRACAMDRLFRQTTHIRACAMDRSRRLFRLFSRHISGTQLFRENRHIVIHLLVVHNPLVPLIGRLVACSARTRADRQTDTQTDRTTTITLAAHARRGLKTAVEGIISCVPSRFSTILVYTSFALAK